MQTNISRSPKPQYFPSMLPPPPLPPMARPVAIIQSTADVSMTGTNSPPASITPPSSETSPADEVPEISSSPPLSPGSHERRKSPSQRNTVPTSSPYSPSRDYSFNHFHGQPGHVGSAYPLVSNAKFDSVSSAFQLFGYTSMSGMSGVISPTNLSMYSPGVTTSRGTPRTSGIPRWNTPLFTLDQEDFSMITHPVTGTNADSNTIILMDEATAASTEQEHANQCCNSTNLMCDADRFFQSTVTADSLDQRDNDQLSTPKSP